MTIKLPQRRAADISLFTKLSKTGDISHDVYVGPYIIRVNRSPDVWGGGAS